MMRDLRHALRALRRTPGFTLAAVLTLGLGIGASTAVFSVIDLVYFHPLPLAHETRLVRLRDFVRIADGRLQESNTSARSFDAVRSQNRVFDAIAAFNYGSATLPGEEAPERVGVVSTTAPLEGTLGVKRVAGRDFSPEEVRIGRDSRVALVSNALWQRRFGPSPLAGAVLQLNGVPHPVIGVLPAGFHFPYDADVWIPARLEPGDEPAVFARLKAGIGIERANADLAAIAGHLRADHPEVGRGFGISATAARRSLIGNEDRVAVGLLVLVGSLLLLTGADVASLLLARAVSRRTEHAIRAALGASRARLFGLAAVEASVLAALAVAVGLFVSLTIQGPLSALVPDNLRHQLGLSRPSLDWRTLAFALAAAAAATVICAAAPAWRSAEDSPDAVLREAGRSSGLGRREGRGLAVLVATEIALAMTLLCGAGSFGLHLWREEQRELGLRTEGVLTMQLALPARFAPGPQRAALVDAILREIRSVSGAALAGVTTVNPLSGGTWVTPIDVEGATPPDASFRFLANYRLITPDLLPAIGAGVLDGRGVDPHDGPGSPPVALLSRSLAERFWPKASPIGKRVRLAGSSGEPWRTVVGVVGDVTDAGDVADTWYVPYAQRADLDGAEEVYVMVRAHAGASAGALSAPVRRAIARADPALGAYAVATMDEVRRQVLARERLGSLLIGLLAAFGTVVALLGTYGVTNYGMERRRREIGLRIALGAGPRRALRDSLGKGLTPVAAGIGAGLLLTTLEAAVLRTLVPGLEVVPLLAALGLAGTLATAAILGSLAPAMRLSRLDPAVTIREQT
jgi:putative ABC transport system permease protein